MLENQRVADFSASADFQALFQHFAAVAALLDAGAYKHAIWKQEGLSALNVQEAESSELQAFMRWYNKLLRENT